MTIICCTDDIRLKEKISAISGENEVSFWPDFQQIHENTLQGGQLVVVDLKYTAFQGQHYSLPIIALTAIPNFIECTALLQQGVRGYGNRQMRQENLAQAVDTVKAGQIWLPPAIISQLIASIGTAETTQPDNGILNNLSDREQEVARYVAKGMSNQEMADTMFVSLRTIKAHLSSIYGKTGLRNRLELGLRLKSGK